MAANRLHVDVQRKNSRCGKQRTQICLVIINYSGVWFLVVLAIWNHSSSSYRVVYVLKMWKNLNILLEKAAVPCKQAFLLMLSDTGAAIVTCLSHWHTDLCSPEAFTLKKLLCNGKPCSYFYINFPELIAYYASSF